MAKRRADYHSLLALLRGFRTGRFEVIAAGAHERRTRQRGRRRSVYMDMYAPTTACDHSIAGFGALLLGHYLLHSLCENPRDSRLRIQEDCQTEAKICSGRRRRTERRSPAAALCCVRAGRLAVVMLQLLVAPLTAATPPPELFPHGYSDCPCIDPFPLIGPGSNDSSCSGVLRANPMSSSVCYPREYGARGCRRYDGASSDECQGNNPPGWCLDQWCFVSPWNCWKPNEPSAFFSDMSVGNETLNAEAAARNCTGADCTTLAYSYATCGNIDHFTLYYGLKTKMDNFAKRGTLRVSIPGDDAPYQTTVDANATNFVAGTSRRDGSIPRFILGEAGVLHEFGFDWEETPISAASRAFSPDSSYTACAHDIAINNTDICVGPFWTFEYRQRLTDFTFAFEQQRIKVVAFQVTGAKAFDASELLYRPFMPFSLAMWLNLLVALLYAGYAMYVLDSSGSSGFKATRRQRAAHPAYFPRTSNDAKDLMLSLANSLQGFLGGGDFRHNPRSLLSWLVFIGFSFLVLVSVSNYTAQITAMSVLKASSGAITSLNEGITRGYKFCGWASAQQSIEAAFPLIRGFYVPLEDGIQSFRLMDTGECDAALVTEDAWAIAQVLRIRTRAPC